MTEALVAARHPDHRWRGVGERDEALFAVSLRVLEPLDLSLQRGKLLAERIHGVDFQVLGDLLGVVLARMIIR